jgi:UDP-4-amino-4-deoxy-L-arabinose formyltransferase/UDP-glucuronic acid dehydrogenase (UDP-4-keto-hexauronic acid decarboxylating)
MLLDAAERLAGARHQIVLVATSRPAEFYDAGIGEFKELARRHGAPFFGDGDIASLDRVAAIEASRADLAVSVNWPRILQEPDIRRFRLGILNAHAGDLPRYRGNACPNWAILNGEPHVGLCVHFMEPGAVDTGPVLVRDKIALAEDTYIGDVYRWLSSAIPELFERAVSGLADGSLVPQPQPNDPAAALRCYPRRPEDARIEWTWDALRVMRLVRASSRPFAGAYSTHESGVKVTVWRAETSQDPVPFCAVPGQILMLAAGDPVIACGAGAIRLTEFEVEGAIGTDAARAFFVSSLRARLR